MKKRATQQPQVEAENDLGEEFREEPILYRRSGGVTKTYRVELLPREEYWFGTVERVRVKERPLWAQNAEQLRCRALGKSALDRIQIAKLYWLQGKTSRQIAAKLGITKNAVEQVVKKIGVPKKFPIDEKTLLQMAVGKRAAIRAIIANMFWQQNLPASKIADDLGMTENAVKNVIKRIRLSKSTPSRRLI